MATTKKATTYPVALVNITDGSVSGHKAGCADLKRGALRKHADEVWEFEAATKAEARAAYNADFDYATEGWHGIEWAACAKHVPAGVEPEDAVDPVLVAAVQAEKAPAAAPAAKRVPTLAATKGEQVCRVCAESKPLTSFPTKAANKAGEVLREDRCRACRAEARTAKKAPAKKAPAKKKA